MWVAACREGRFSWRFHSQRVSLSLGSPKPPPKVAEGRRHPLGLSPWAWEGTRDKDKAGAAHGGM